MFLEENFIYYEKSLRKKLAFALELPKSILIDINCLTGTVFSINTKIPARIRFT